MTIIGRFAKPDCARDSGALHASNGRMDRLSLPLALAVLLEAVPGLATAADRQDRQQSQADEPAPGQKPADDPGGWQGYPNRVLNEQTRCRKRTWKRVAANTYRELFADKWIDQAEPSSAAELHKAGIRKDAPAILPLMKFRSMAEDGYVEIFALIDAQGGVAEAHVVCSTGPEFHDFALTAVRKTIYTPASVAGKPIASVIRRPYLFTSSSH